MYKEKEFTKDMITWQTTIVKFRNGLVGLAVNDKISKDDHDGNEGFIVYDLKTKKFVDRVELRHYDNNLRNKFSMKGILKKIHNVMEGNLHSDVELNDIDWDIVNVAVYVHALDAFKILTSGETLYWLYEINKNPVSSS